MVEAVGHNWGEGLTVDREPSCTETGIKSLHCRECNKEKEGSQEEIPVTDHRWDKGEETKKPPCDKCGEITFTCISCGMEVHKVKANLEHKYGYWAITLKPTYFKEGLQSRRCSVCGKMQARTIDKLVHKSIESATFNSIKRRDFNGKLQTPAITVKYKGKVLRKDIDYILSYRSNRKPGKAYVHLTGSGDYSGKKVLSFFIVPNTPKIKNISSSKNRQVTISIKKVSYASGYQVAYSNNKIFKGAKYINFKGSNKVINKLKSLKNYYFKIRSYKQVDRVKIYSSYSKVKRVYVK